MSNTQENTQLLRADLVGKVTADIDSEWWEARLATPRHPFVTAGYFEQDVVDSPYWRPVAPHTPEWMTGCYEDRALVTELAGTLVPLDVDGRVAREPTNLMLRPGLIMRILQAARIEPGMRVLMVGIGYGMGLLCHRLGDSQVVGIDLDPQVHERTQAALAELGYSPSLRCGDGRDGYAEGGPYDRIISTVAVRDTPTEWLKQIKPGGQIVTAIGGWMGSTALARMTVSGCGVAIGRILEGPTHTLLASGHTAPPLGPLPETSEAEERPVRIAPAVLEDSTARFVAQAAEAWTQIVRRPATDGCAPYALYDKENPSWVTFHRDGDRWIVRQGGETLLWDRIEYDLVRWRAHGSPHIDQFLVATSREHEPFLVTWTSAL